MLEKLSEAAKRTLFLARYEASQAGHTEITPEHLLFGLLVEGEEVAMELLRRSEIYPEVLRAELEKYHLARRGEVSTSVEVPFSAETKRILKMAEEEADRLLHPYVGGEHLLIGLLRMDSSPGGEMLRERGLRLYAVREEIVRIWKERSLPKRTRETPFLNEFSRDLSEMAARKVFDPLIGRKQELQRILQILCRRRKNNPVLLGEPGVGKTAIIEGLAVRIQGGNIPIALRNRRILALDLSLIVAGTKYRGQFEERLKGIISELHGCDDVIIFIDEIHSLVGAGSAEGSLDAASILKPALSRGEVQCIGATTPREYHRYIERDRPLVRRFQPVQIAPSSTEEAVKILFGLRERYEQFHRVRYTDEAIQSAVLQSCRYITDRFLPDKAIDVMDEAGAWARLKLDGEESSDGSGTERRTAVAEGGGGNAVHTPFVVGKDEVEEVISRWTGIPLASVKKEEAEKLIRMEEFLHRRIVGQEEAISALSRSIRRSRAGLRSPLRPVGSFIFLGPTGVGKTEVAKTLAEFLFGNERSLIRFDMSEYMEKHAVARMIGAPPGYVGYEEGGLLTEAIKRKPYSVLLLDEIEKAHPEVLHILLQVLEDGGLTDAWGDRIDFRNTLILMTSNIGSTRFINGSQLGFASDAQNAEYQRRKEWVLREVKRLLNPEFLNRIDEIVVFDTLNEENLLEIARRMVEELNRSLSHRGLRLQPREEVFDWLIQTTCGDRSFGARPLRRAIQKHIEDGIAEHLIMGKLPGKGDIEIFLRDGAPAFRAVLEMEPAG